MFRLVSVTLVLVCWVACGGSDDTERAPVNLCSDGYFDQAFELVDGPRETRVRIDAEVFADELWIGFSADNGEGMGDFDVFVSTVGCEGVGTSVPRQVTSQAGRLDANVAMRAMSDRMLIAWNADSGQSPVNLSIPYRIMNDAGEFLSPETIDLETSYDGEPNANANHWMPLVSVAGDEFVIAGARGISAAPSFQVFSTFVDRDGAAVRTMHPPADADNTHTDPDVIAGPNGQVTLAWEQGEVGEPLDIVYSQFGGPGWSWSSVSETIPGAVGSEPRFARGAPEQGPLVVFRDSDDGRVVLSKLGEPTGAVFIGDTGQQHVFPTAAVNRSGYGMVAWHEVVQGSRGKVNVQAFYFDGATFSLGEVQELTDSALAYGPEIIRIGPDLYFVAWTASTGDDQRAMGQFLPGMMPPVGGTET